MFSTRGHDNRARTFCKAKFSPTVYNVATLRDTPVEAMAQTKNRQEARLQELIVNANRMNIEVRTEKLLREAGYRAHSGRCRIKGQDVILIDRDAPIADQIEFLGNELAERQKQLETSESAQPNISN